MEVEVEAEPERKLWWVLVGVDPGMVNLGIGGIRFYGVVECETGEGEEREDGDEEGPEYLPDIEIITMEKWDLSRGIIERPSPNVNRKMVIRLTGHPDRSDKIKNLCTSLSQSIARSEWIFQSFTCGLTGEEQLPIWVIENQCDRHKNKVVPENAKKPEFIKNRMTIIQNASTTAVQTIDYRNKWEALESREARKICVAMSKYGQRCDGSKSYKGRKMTGVEVLKELLWKLNTPNTLSFLRYLEHLEGGQGKKGEKIDDICDAILLAIDRALYLREKYLKQKRMESTDKEERAELMEERRKIRKVPTQPKTLPSLEPEFPDDEDQPPKKKRKTTAKPSAEGVDKEKKKRVYKKKKAIVTESTDSPPVQKTPKKRTKKDSPSEPKPKTPRKKKTLAEKVPKKSKAPKGSKPPKESKKKATLSEGPEFPKLLLDITKGGSDETTEDI